MALKKTEATENDKKQNENKPEEIVMDAGMQQKLLDQINALEKRLTASENKATAPVSGGNEELISSLTKALNLRGGSTSDQFESIGYIDENTIDKDDILKKENYVRFYAHHASYVIVDDLRNGIPVQTPFKNPIKLDYTASKTVGAGRFEEREHMCVYTCKSKKEAEWLKQHSLYGLIFYSTDGDLVTIDAKKATQMASLMLNLNAQDKYQIIQQCKDNDIEMREDVQLMKMALANKLVGDISMREQKADENRIKQNVFEKEEFDKHH